MIEKIESKIKELEEIYDFYLEKWECDNNDQILSTLLNELRVEIKTYKNCIKIINGEDNEYMEI